MRSSDAVLACLLALSLLGAGTAAAQPAWHRERIEAVDGARRGQTAPALTTLDRLQREHPDDIGVLYDLIVVSVWARQDAEALQLYARLPQGVPADYVLEAVGVALRRTGDPAAALALYRQALRRSPGNPEFRAGEIRSLADLGDTAPALAIADADLAARGEHGDVLLAAAYAASKSKRPVVALVYLDRALRLDPANREARHDRIVAIDEMGAPQVARVLAEAEPGLLSDAEFRRVEGNEAAALVRWGVLEPPSEELRFAASDRAIVALDALIARWSTQGEAARPDILRARFDRMVALRDRVRMDDVLAEYAALTREGADLPGFATVAAADAHLYTRQPEIARDLFRQGLAVDPRNPETRLALFYALVELDDFTAAYDEADRAASDQAVWLYLKGLTDPVPNPDRATADLTAANARLFADELVEAYRRISAMAEAAPNNSRFRTALANVYAARGWPRLAAQEYQVSRALVPRNVSNEVGEARNLLQLREYRSAETRVADLVRRFPENLEVRRLARLWDVHNMADLRINAERGIRSATSIQGGSGLSLGAQVYSSPFSYNWRMFAAAAMVNEGLPAGEGAINLRRSALGFEYRDPSLVASLEGTLSVYGPEKGNTLWSGIGGGRAGARAQATWSTSDKWQVGGTAEIFARDTPLRALRNGITADAASARIGYRESESRQYVLDISGMTFSDGNRRAGIGGRYVERLWTSPRLAIDGTLGVAGTRNSADANRPYFNPKQDALVSYGVAIVQPIYRRYEFVYDHRLVATPGIYWQQGFGSGTAFNVLYEHRVRANDVFEAGLGLSYGRQPYDGNLETNMAVLFNTRIRF